MTKLVKVAKSKKVKKPSYYFYEPKQSNPYWSIVEHFCVDNLGQCILEDGVEIKYDDIPLKQLYKEVKEKGCSCNYKEFCSEIKRVLEN